MEIINKSQRTKARQRFWWGYLLSMLVVGVITFMLVRLPQSIVNLESASVVQSQKRDALWRKTADAADAIDAMSDMTRTTSYASLSADERERYNDMDSKFQSLRDDLRRICRGQDSLNFKDPYRVLKALEGYSAQTEKVKEEMEKSMDQKLKEMKDEYESKIERLEDKNDELQDKLNEANMKAATGAAKPKAGGGGGGGAANPYSAPPAGGGSHETGAANTAALEQERNAANQKLKQARDMAFDIMKHAGTILDVANELKKNTEQKNAILNEVSNIKTYASNIRKL